MTSPTTLPAWQTLTQFAALPQPHLRERLAQPGRDAMQASADGTGIQIDFTHQALDSMVWNALLQLAREANVEAQRDAMFRGDAINTSEQRAVLHTALRGTLGATGEAAPWGDAIQQLVQAELYRVCDFADRVRSGDVKGSTGLAITDVVNIGIGGSDLGPRMAADALAPLCSDGKTGVRVHFVSNPDAWALHSTLRSLNPLTTLLIVASKTFTTQATMTNAASARRWLQAGGITGSAHLHLLGLGGWPLLHLVCARSAAGRGHRFTSLPRISGWRPDHGRALSQRPAGAQPARRPGAERRVEPQLFALPHPAAFHLPQPPGALCAVRAADGHGKQRQTRAPRRPAR
jgi:glucose-6-phosphate isomerase